MKNFFVFFSSICLLTTIPCLAQNDRYEAFSPALKVGNGLRAEYFNGRDFQEKVHNQIDEEINFFYRTASPAPGVYPENYSIRWTGSLYAPVTGTYKIIVRVDDGVRLWVNGVKILDKWQLQKAITYSGQVDLEAGEYYSLKIEYFNGPTFGIIQLMWEVPEDKPGSFFGLTAEPAREIIPKNYLYGELKEEEAARVAREKKKTSPLL